MIKDLIIFIHVLKTNTDTIINEIIKTNKVINGIKNIIFRFNAYICNLLLRNWRTNKCTIYIPKVLLDNISIILLYLSFTLRFFMKYISVTDIIYTGKPKLL